ncbi:MAG: hypothetical protein LBB74_03135 [Chitinispirillales bacterium]|jgi:hypothetical protein|nr:hypothetical protein [Chitinispirillales bacterium]
MLKHQFKLALASAGLTQLGWANRNGVHQSAVSNVLTGNLKSAPVERLMRAFIAETLPQLEAELAAMRAA